MIHDSFIYYTILQKELSVYSSLNIFFYFFLNIQLSSSFSSSYFELRTFTHHAEIPFLNFSQDTCHPHILFLHLLSPFSILFFFISFSSCRATVDVFITNKFQFYKGRGRRDTNWIRIPDHSTNNFSLLFVPN